VALLPIDTIRWTEAYAKALDEIGRRAKEELGATRLEMRLSGRMSPLAKKETSARGWTVVEGVPAGAAPAAAPAK